MKTLFALMAFSLACWWGYRRCFIARVKSEDTPLAVLIRDRGVPSSSTIAGSGLFKRTYRISGYLGRAILLCG